MVMRISLTHIHFIAFTVLCASTVSAQTFPTRPIRVVIPYAPGGGVDNLIRSISSTLTTSMGQQLVLDTRPGGSSIIGTEIVARASPDGYTVLVSDSAFLINPALFRKLPFDTRRDFSCVTMLAYAPVILVVHPSVAANSIKELIALARAKSGTLNFASGGNGTSTHIAGALMKYVAKIDITHIPYKGVGIAMTDLVGGQVQMLFSGISSARAYIDAGRLRALAVTGKVRNPAVPSVPTFEEAGLPGIDVDSYWGVYAPARTPAPVIQSMNRYFVDAVRAPANAEKLNSLGYSPLGNSAQECTSQMRSMIEHWIDVIQKTKIQVE
jgi:tripartite-type tricarboxylate transporter receptor subunit TctC